MSFYYLSRYYLVGWVKEILKKYETYWPQFYEGKLYYHKGNSEKLINEEEFYQALKTIRPSNSLKELFFYPKLKVAGFIDNKPTPLSLTNEPRVVIGAKACDLRGLKVHEIMYLQDDEFDPFHKNERARTIIVAADCPEPQDSCFCNLVGLKPYSEELADVVVSVLKDGYLFEVRTEKGKELLENHQQYFKEATSEKLEERNQIRNAAQEKLKLINTQPLSPKLSEGIKEKKEAEFWQKHAQSCVECFGCLLACPTCFCFLLYDVPQNKTDFERYKIWDACYYYAYARVGGGMNPRAQFWQRFCNRFHCKFMNFYFAHHFYACSGCGRCFTVCMGKIDIRNLLKEIV
jgi:NAD-dependent dihydropyrimidine dehydrogenase PreA subunit